MKACKLLRNINHSRVKTKIVFSPKAVLKPAEVPEIFMEKVVAVSDSESDKEEVNVYLEVIDAPAPAATAPKILNVEHVVVDGRILKVVAATISVPPNPDNFMSQVPMESDTQMLSFIDAT